MKTPTNVIDIKHLHGALQTLALKLLENHVGTPLVLTHIRQVVDPQCKLLLRLGFVFLMGDTDKVTLTPLPWAGGPIKNRIGVVEFMILRQHGEPHTVGAQDLLIGSPSIFVVPEGFQWGSGYETEARPTPDVELVAQFCRKVWALKGQRAFRRFFPKDEVRGKVGVKRGNDSEWLWIEFETDQPTCTLEYHVEYRFVGVTQLCYYIHHSLAQAALLRSKRVSAQAQAALSLVETGAPVGGA